MPLADKCHLHIPHKDWAMESGDQRTQGIKERENYSAIERWAEECVGGDCCCDWIRDANEPGTLTGGTLTSRWYAPRDTALVEVQATLTTPGSTTTTIDIYHSSVGSVQALSLTSGVSTTSATFTPALTLAKLTDYTYAGITIAGTSAAGLVVTWVFNDCVESEYPVGCL